MYSEHRVEEVRQSDSLSLGGETEKVTVPIERPGQSTLNHLKAWLIVPIEEPSAYVPSRWYLVR